MHAYDAIVIGLGAMGSASVYQLAKKGAKVLGIDQFTPPHTFGSSHGETRITRQAIAEGKEYVPLVLRANELWKEIEQEVSERLYIKTGILIMGGDAFAKPEGFVNNTLTAAEHYGIEHEKLDRRAIALRYPQFNLQGHEQGYFEPGAGYLRAEACVQAQLTLAAKRGVQLRYGEIFISYSQSEDGLVVRTSKDKYMTNKLVLTMGPWVRNVLPDTYRDVIKIYRQVLYWFEIHGDSEQFKPGNFPVFNWEFNTAHEDFMYGFPTIDGKSIKVATEQYAETSSPETVNRSVSAAEIQHMYEQYARPHIPGLSKNCLRAEACLYSVAPNWRFLIDRMPDNPNILIASPCSGHGFKHSAAIGEVLADMALGQQTSVDVSSFSLEQLANR